MCGAAVRKEAKRPPEDAAPPAAALKLAKQAKGAPVVGLMGTSRPTAKSDPTVWHDRYHVGFLPRAYVAQGGMYDGVLYQAVGVGNEYDNDKQAGQGKARVQIRKRAGHLPPQFWLVHLPPQFGLVY